METKNIGKIIQVKDSVVLISGLSQVGYNQLVSIQAETGRVPALVLNLQTDQVGAVVLGDSSLIKQGDLVEFLEESLSIDVSEELLGQVVGPLGNSLTGHKLQVVTKGESMFLERVAAGVLARKDVSRPLYTGIIAVDLMIPVGRGQRELIIGDKKTGKTSICIDAIINQKGRDVICIYVAIGQKASKISRIRQLLIDYKAMDYTIIVAANASDPTALQYLAPYSGSAIAEYFAQKGKDVLIIYDDLSKHANAYREISLLLNRPAGREAYPGDIFYLHSRLLERSLQYSDKMGGGSITALPVIETQAGDVSAYIPTNVISITDGQIYLDGDLFNSGQRPAINVGASVSRVGSSAQNKGAKQVAGQLKLDLAQFRELQAFAQFGSDLDADTTEKLRRGELISALLNQTELKPLSISHQIVIFYAAIHGKIKFSALSEIEDWRYQYITFMNDKGKNVLKELEDGKKIENDLEQELIKLIDQFNQTYG
ncbi:MAG: F0F1 ATP synthase subunit alpha [Candidatus Shapirobacteria bacterium]|nr:F0F1 ATP synthase subunit alpha [Candidatus Shapirobacteria bacterium]